MTPLSGDRRLQRLGCWLIDAILLTATAGVVVAAVNGANPDLFENAKLQAWDGDASNEFGISVAIDDETLVAGAYADDGGGSEAGAVYVFQHSASGPWEGLVKLKASDAQPDDHFGWKVGLSGPTLAVSAIGVLSYRGAVYIFEARGDSSWAEVAKLTASNRGRYEAFGASLAMDGETVLVGAPWANGANTESGSVYVFERDPAGVWGESAKLDVAGLATSAFLGQSVALNEDTALVGASGDTVDGVRSGAAYVFERSGALHEWTQQVRLTPPDPEPDEHFGNSVALSEGWIAVGADDYHGPVSGSVYLYRQTGGAWEFVTEVQAPEPGIRGFGWTVALGEEQLLVGLYFENSGPGKAFLFKRAETPLGAEWTFSRTLLASDSSAGDHFGQSVAISGRTLVVNQRGGGADGDAVYIFSEDVFSDGFESGDTSAWSDVVP